MPQAIQPGAYTSLYTQQLIKTVLMQLLQSGGQPAAVNGINANTALMQNVDTMIGSSVVSLDTQLSSVGVGIGNSLTQQPANVPNNGLMMAAPVQMVAPVQQNALAVAPQVGQPAVVTPTSANQVVLLG